MHQYDEVFHRLRRAHHHISRKEKTTSAIDGDSIACDHLAELTDPLGNA
jgi:hypothetical protein